MSRSQHTLFWQWEADKFQYYSITVFLFNGQTMFVQMTKQKFVFIILFQSETSANQIHNTVKATLNHLWKRNIYVMHFHNWFRVASVSARLHHCGNPKLQSEMVPRKMKNGPFTKLSTCNLHFILGDQKFWWSHHNITTAFFLYWLSVIINYYFLTHDDLLENHIERSLLLKHSTYFNPFTAKGSPFDECRVPPPIKN